MRAECLAHARTLCSDTGQGLNPNHRVQSPGSSCSKGLKVNQKVDFSCIKLFFTSYVLSSLRLFKPETEEQIIQTDFNHTEVTTWPSMLTIRLAHIIMDQMLD